MDRGPALQEVVDLMPDVLFRCYKDDGKIYWSLNEGGLAREFHLTTDEIKGLSLEELFPGGASEEIRDHFEAAFRGETTPFVNEIDGRFFKHFPQPMYDDSGNIVEVVGFISEVTELVQSQRELEVAYQDLDAFAHSVSHDLRAPLTAIRNYVATMRHAPDQLESLASRVDNTIDRMDHMISAMLAFSASHNAPLTLTEIDVSSIAHDLALMWPGVRWDIEDGLTLVGDEAMTRILLQNLMGNASKFTAPRRQPIVEIRREGGDIVVADNGIGFSMSEAERIFQPFVRAATEVPGSGVGLATVQRIVERHGGAIEARGAPDKGAAFLFHFA